jgi:TatD DNase family protein
MFTDSHCHLSFPGLAGRLDDVLARMADHRVDRAICICTTLEEFDAVYGLAQNHANLWCSVGVHPDNEGVLEPSLADLLAGAGRSNKVVAIGETGLDYYRLGDRTVADMAWQRQRFSVHIEAARQTGLPLVVHTRQASDDTLAILTADGRGEVGGVFHCFTETAAVARAALDLGFYISFSGIVTFKNAQDLRDVVAMVPLDRMLIETDSPYLAPVPMRGKTNEPAFVSHVADAVARIKGVSIEVLADVTTRNVDALFSRITEGATAC